MTLVDTSAWVEFFRGRSPFADAVDTLLEGNEVAVCGPVLTELRRGLRPSERGRVLTLLGACRMLEQPPNLWEEAGDLGYLVARRGVTAKTVDLLIAAHAVSHGVALLAKDRDFGDLRRAGVRLVLMHP